MATFCPLLEEMLWFFVCLFVCLFVCFYLFVCCCCLFVCFLFVCLFVCMYILANTPHLDGRDVLGYDVCRVGSRVEQSALKPANKYKIENGNSTAVMETRKHYDRAMYSGCHKRFVLQCNCSSPHTKQAGCTGRVQIVSVGTTFALCVHFHIGQN